MITNATGLGATQDFQSYNNLVVGAGNTLDINSDLSMTPSGLDGMAGATVAALGDNGDWGAGQRFAAVLTTDSDFVGSLTFAFGAFKARAAGAFLNGFAEGGPASITIEAFDALGNLLEAQPVSITAGGLNGGEFYGIQRDSYEIASIRFTGDSLVLDNLAYAPVPEPSTYVLLAAGLGLLGLMVRRSRNTA